MASVIFCWGDRLRYLLVLTWVCCRTAWKVRPTVSWWERRRGITAPTGTLFTPPPDSTRLTWDWKYRTSRTFKQTYKQSLINIIKGVGSRENKIISGCLFVHMEGRKKKHMTKRLMRLMVSGERRHDRPSFWWMGKDSLKCQRNDYAKDRVTWGALVKD